MFFIWSDAVSGCRLTSEEKSTEGLVPEMVSGRGSFCFADFCVLRLSPKQDRLHKL